MGLAFGELAGRMVSQRIQASVANAAALGAAYSYRDCDPGMVVHLADRTTWQYDVNSTATDASGQLVVPPVDNIGRWLRVGGQLDLKLAVGFGTADAAVLFTVPVGYVLRVSRAFWEITTSFAGGTSSAIGLSSNNSAYTTKGDLLGGASGDVAATLISTTPGPFVGTQGAKIGTATPVVLVAGNTIRFDRVASVFTSGAGFAHIPVEQIA